MLRQTLIAAKHIMTYCCVQRHELNSPCILLCTHYQKTFSIRVLEVYNAYILRHVLRFAVGHT
jgi:hypothetical protein